MGSYRAARLAELIHREVAQMLGTDVKDARLEPISITRVEVARDLSHATIEYLPLGGGKVSKELATALSDCARRLRGPVGRALGIRHSPELVFKVDEHTEAAIRVSSLIEKIKRDAEPQKPPEEAAEASDAASEEGES